MMPPINFQNSLLCRVDSNAGPGRGPAECVLYSKNKDGVLPFFFCISCNTFLKLRSLNFQDSLLRGLDPRAGPGRGPAELVYYHKNKDGMLPKFEISVWCMLRNTLLKLRSLNFQDSLLGGLDSRAEPGRGPAELVLYYKDKDGMLPKLDISVSLSFCNIFLK